MTVDEELTLLEDSIRKLKIEFDTYFAGGKPRPPFDSQWRVETAIKRLDSPKLAFAQRFRLNGIISKYALYADMWRKKVRFKEEGREEPWKQRRAREEPAAEAASKEAPQPAAAFRVQWKDPEQESEKVDKLFQALVEAKKKVGESTDSLSADSFRRFVKQKTDQLKKGLGAQNVEYTVEVENGQVRLKAKGS